MANLFTKIPPGVVRLETLLSRHGANAVLRTGASAWAFAPPGSGGGIEGPAVHGVFGDSAVTVWLAGPEWRLVIGEALGVPPEAVEACPEPFVRAALESVASDALAAIERSTGLALSLKGVELTPSKPVGPALCFAMANERGLVARFAALFAKPEGQWAGALEKRLAGLPAVERALPDDLPLPAGVWLGAIRVAAGVLSELEAGDVVLFPAGNALRVVVGGRRRFAARHVDGILRVEGGGMAEASTDPEGRGGDAADIDAIEVEVTAQVGRVVMTLAELRRLGEGQTVEFASPVESPARLVVGGKTVATGELVDVGGRVGVRILTMGGD